MISLVDEHLKVDIRVLGVGEDKGGDDLGDGVMRVLLIVKGLKSAITGGTRRTTISSETYRHVKHVHHGREFFPSNAIQVERPWGIPKLQR